MNHFLPVSIARNKSLLIQNKLISEANRCIDYATISPAAGIGFYIISGKAAFEI
jgi:hypothetical protein